MPDFLDKGEKGKMALGYLFGIGEGFPACFLTRFRFWCRMIFD